MATEAKEHAAAIAKAPKDEAEAPVLAACRPSADEPGPAARRRARQREDDGARHAARLPEPRGDERRALEGALPRARASAAGPQCRARGHHRLPAPRRRTRRSPSHSWCGWRASWSAWRRSSIRRGLRVTTRGGRSSASTAAAARGSWPRRPGAGGTRTSRPAPPSWRSRPTCTSSSAARGRDSTSPRPSTVLWMRYRAGGLSARRADGAALRHGRRGSDNPDMHPDAVTDILSLVRTLWHPALVFVLAGDSAMFLDRIRRTVEVPHLKVADPKNFALDFFAKVVPRHHRLSMAPPLQHLSRFDRWIDLLNRAKVGRTDGTLGPITLTQVLQAYPVLQDLLPRRLRRRTRLEGLGPAPDGRLRCAGARVRSLADRRSWILRPCRVFGRVFVRPFGPTDDGRGAAPRPVRRRSSIVDGGSSRRADSGLNEDIACSHEEGGVRHVHRSAGRACDLRSAARSQRRVVEPARAGPVHSRRGKGSPFGLCPRGGACWTSSRCGTHGTKQSLGFVPINRRDRSAWPTWTSSRGWRCGRPGS